MLRIVIVLFFATFLSAQTGLVTRQEVLMGTFVSLSVDRVHEALLHPSFALLKEIDASLSTFNKNSPIYKLNHNKKAKLNDYSYEALQLSRNYYKKTDGYFDIAVGIITKDLYGFGDDERVASSKKMRMSSTNIKKLVLHKHEATIKDGIKIDLGGMGKGYGVDKVTNYLKSHHVKKAIIALSGDIRCIGECFMAVNNPFDNKHPLATFRMKDSGITTSGNYNRYVKNTKYNHLINPKTKTSQNNFISVTLVSTSLSSATLDAYATAVSVMPLKKAYQFLEAQKVGFIILQTDKQLRVSQNISEYVENLEVKRLRF